MTALVVYGTLFATVLLTKWFFSCWMLYQFMYKLLVSNSSPYSVLSCFILLYRFIWHVTNYHWWFLIALIVLIFFIPVVLVVQAHLSARTRHTCLDLVLMAHINIGSSTVYCIFYLDVGNIVNLFAFNISVNPTNFLLVIWSAFSSQATQLLASQSRFRTCF